MTTKRICECAVCIAVDLQYQRECARNEARPAAVLTDAEREHVSFEGMDDMAEYQRLELQIKKELGW